MKSNIALIFFFLFSVSIFSQSSIEKGLESINKQDAEKYIGILASDSLEGRKPGEPGGIKAGEYIKNTYVELGIKPWRKDYFQPFESTSFRSSGNQMRNVLGYIRGKNANEVVIIGAHYDHLGIRKTPIDNDSIFNGADDNASGVSAVLQVAKAFAASGERPERTIIFALWDGEEMGLLGSFYFVEDYFTNIPPPMLSAPAIKGYINCDMIGRNKNDDPTHVIAYYSTEKPFGEWIVNDVEEYNLNLTPDFPSMDDMSGGSDHFPFMQKGVPFIFFFTDLHKDYHKVTDHADKINYDKVTEISKVAFLNLWRMANMENF